MFDKLRKIVLNRPDEGFVEWLTRQNKRTMVLGIACTMMTATVLSYYDYFYYADTVYADMTDPPARYFGLDNAYRLGVVPLLGMAALLLAGSSWNDTLRKREWLSTFVLVTNWTGILSTWLFQYHYNANDYTYDMLSLIVFSMLLFGLLFRTSLLLSSILVASVLVVLLLDQEIKNSVLFYNSVLTVMVWLPMVVGTYKLEQARHANYLTIAKLETAQAELLKQTHQLKSKNEELQQFAYASSHDLQEPLRTITNFVRVLNKNLESQLTEENRQYMDIVMKSTDRMKNLILAILEYSRIGRNKNLETFDCKELAEGVLADLGLAIEEAQAQVHVGPLPKVTAYRAELATLLQNLVSNALKFRQPNEPTVVNIQARLEGPEHVFSVSDNGIGIDAKYAGKVFQLFARLHSKDEYEGTGIGLSHSKKIAELHGGRIWLESQAGLGTTFFFTIPTSIKTDPNETEIELHHAD